MQYRTFGRTKLQVSAVSLGGAYLQGTDPECIQENANAVVCRALELGINYIDTAPLYGSSEALLGEALKGEKRPFYTATKVGFKPEGFDYKSDSVQRSLENSLELLGLEQLTVAQIHEVNLAGWERIMEKGGTLEGLRLAQQQGLCQFIGITGRAIPLLAQLAATGEFDTALFYHDYHPCVQLANKEVLPALAVQNMGCVAASVLAGGLYIEGTKQHDIIEAIKDPVDRQHTQAVLARLREESSSLPQSAFRYVLADPRVSTVSSGAANVRELEEVVQALEMEPLVL